MYIGDATHSAKSVQLSVSNNLRRNLDADEAIWRGVQHTFSARSQLLAPLAILSKIDMIARSNGNSMETIGISHCRLPQTSGEFRNLALGISKSKRLCRSQKHRPSQTLPDPTKASAGISKLSGPLPTPPLAVHFIQCNQCMFITAVDASRMVSRRIPLALHMDGGLARLAGNQAMPRPTPSCRAMPPGRMVISTESRTTPQGQQCNGPLTEIQRNHGRNTGMQQVYSRLTFAYLP